MTRCLDWSISLSNLLTGTKAFPTDNFTHHAQHEGSCDGFSGGNSVGLSDAEYRVRVKKGLSKAYTLEKLRRARDSGKVDDTDLCTSDEGENFYRLGELLTYAEAMASQSVMQQNPDASSADSQMQRSTYGFQPVFEPEDPSLRSSTSSVQSSGLVVHASERRGPSDNESDESNYLGGPAAAEDALNSALIRRRQAREAGEKNSVTEAPDFIGDIGAPTPGGTGFSLQSFLAGCAGGILVTAISAASWFALGTGSDSDLVLASVFEGANVHPVIADSGFESMSLDELSARVRIMNAQLKHVARSASVNVDAAPLADELSSLPSQQTKLLPFVPVRLSPQERVDFDRLFQQYAELVQNSGPDGRRIDERTVALFSERLIRLIAQPGQDDATRTAAAHDASEKCKLLYLLQLGRLDSESSEEEQTGQRAIQQASQAACARLFVEIAAGDATFSEVFQAASTAEKQELLQLRYWYYRAVDPRMAAKWLDQMLKENADINAADVRASVAEVDAIENS